MAVSLGILPHRMVGYNLLGSSIFPGVRFKILIRDEREGPSPTIIQLMLPSDFFFFIDLSDHRNRSNTRVILTLTASGAALHYEPSPNLGIFTRKQYANMLIFSSHTFLLPSSCRQAS